MQPNGIPLTLPGLNGRVHAPYRHASRLEVEVIDDPAAFQALGSEWNALVEEAGLRHPFATHEWLTAWWDHFGAGRTLHVVLLKSGQRPRAIFPLAISQVSWFGLPVRRIGPFYNLHAPKGDFIVPPGIAAEAYQALWLHLKHIAAGWDVFELSMMEAQNPALGHLAESAAAENHSIGHWDFGGSPFVPTTGRWEDYLKTLGKNHRANHRRRLRRLGELGELRLETAETGDRLNEVLDAGFGIEALAWKGSAGTAVQSDPVLQAYYRDSSRRLDQQRWLKLYFLTLDGRRIAFQYCLQYRGRIFLIKPGYDPEFAKYSPSHLLTWLILEQAFGSGIVEYDFVGAEDPWKLAWTSHKHPQQWLYIFTDSLYGRCLHTLKFRAAPAVKRLLKKD